MSIGAVLIIASRTVFGFSVSVVVLSRWFNTSVSAVLCDNEHITRNGSIPAANKPAIGEHPAKWMRAIGNTAGSPDASTHGAPNDIASRQLANFSDIVSSRSNTSRHGADGAITPTDT